MTWRDEQGEPEDLTDAVTHVLEEGRMLLPGIQATFGFQLIAVFQDVFHNDLEPAQQRLHMMAMAMIAVAMALVLAPAAYRRQAEPDTLTRRFITYASWLLTAGMALLMTAICMDFYLLARVSGIVHGTALGSAGGLFAVFLTLWFIVPWSVRAACHGRDHG
jgi:hypothetical protein